MTNFRLSCEGDWKGSREPWGIVEGIWPKMSVGGVFVYDAHGFPGSAGVTKFANEERQERDRIVIHNLNGHAIILKREA